ncbi:uncharacterized protein LOC111692772 [Anoplophora glabripennis]|uniref:uncharacterized protein LOC111692772 n=1 Tax=Anoplophora glabripennis TaxID=217634 RepID=UPI000C76D37E|nr:uncharacterized protein LOC111692772 [Anoplophora glabripennis]
MWLWQPTGDLGRSTPFACVRSPIKWQRKKRDHVFTPRLNPSICHGFYITPAVFNTNTSVLRTLFKSSGGRGGFCLIFSPASSGVCDKQSPYIPEAFHIPPDGRKRCREASRSEFLISRYPHLSLQDEYVPMVSRFRRRPTRPIMWPNGHHHQD